MLSFCSLIFLDLVASYSCFYAISTIKDCTFSSSPYIFYDFSKSFFRKASFSFSI